MFGALRRLIQPLLAAHRSRCKKRSPVFARHRKTVIYTTRGPLLTPWFGRNFRHPNLSLNPLEIPIFVAFPGLKVVLWLWPRKTLMHISQQNRDNWKIVFVRCGAARWRCSQWSSETPIFIAFSRVIFCSVCFIGMFSGVHGRTLSKKYLKSLCAPRSPL